METLWLLSKNISPPSINEAINVRNTISHITQVDLSGLHYVQYFVLTMSRRMLSLILFLFNTYFVLGFLFSTIENEKEELERAAKHHLACDTYRIRLQVGSYGCLPKSVLTSACYGACRSYAMPG